jgi:carbon-monoxide dehydrogenase small subunit
MNGAVGCAVVNGQAYRLPGDGRTLIRWLRDDLGLTGTKYGCGRGHCGACTVLVDQEPVLACCALAAGCADRNIRTIEGLRGDAAVAPLLEAFLGAGAVQCGYCTPGMIAAACALLYAGKGRPLDEAAVRAGLAGNVCRCTGYTSAVTAVLTAAEAAEGAQSCAR